MPSAEELESTLSLGYELRGMELKGPGSRADKHFLAKVVRAALSMGNLQDGGLVVIGIDDNDPAAMLPGLQDKELAEWNNFDAVSSAMSVYSDPPLRIDIRRLDLRSGARVVLIQVTEFENIPHICIKSYPEVLRNGALYVRTRRMPETAAIANATEMREIVDLATRKALRAYVETADAAGLKLTAKKTPEDGADAYGTEAREAWR